MPMKLAPFLILAIGLGIVAFGLWNERRNPPRITATGEVKVVDRKTGQTHLLETREITIGAVKKEEVRLPTGTWIDCRGDCRDAVRREHFEFWDEQQLYRK